MIFTGSEVRTKKYLFEVLGRGTLVRRGRIFFSIARPKFKLLSGSPAKSSPMTWTSENRLPSIFLC